MSLENDILVLKTLARQYWYIANQEHNHERRILHRAVNDLKMIRPVVIVDDVPWKELNINNELTVLCVDQDFQEVETYMRQTLYRYKYLRGDMIVRPYIPIEKIIRRGGIGVAIDENIKQDNKDSSIVSHHYKDQFEDCEGIDKLHNDTITYDEEETNRKYYKVANVIGDIVPIRKVGVNYATYVQWDNIGEFRGVEPLLVDLIVEPDFSHRLMAKITDIVIDRNEQLRKMGLFDSDPESLHCTPTLCSDLHPELDNMDNKNIWGRAAAQVFSSVSKAMHDEFDITYMKKALQGYGHVYYGCCEQLDQKIDIVEKLPNLRKISISPWANVSVASEIIGGKYVLACKPNPALVAVGNVDKALVRKEICEIMDTCYKYGCSFDMVIKDISTVNHRPENLIEWEKIVMDIVTHY